jgi:hypothetical protein
MKLNNLAKIHSDIRNRNQTYGIFEYCTNGKKFDVFFDVAPTPYKLGFLLTGSKLHLWLDINKGYILNERLLSEQYHNLCIMLGLKYDPNNKFSPFAFFNQFNQVIPNFIVPITSSKKNTVILNFFPDIEETEKLYYKGSIEWDKLNNGRHKTQKNSDKTRLLYPEIYERIKNRNISIIYTANPKEEEDIRRAIF